MVDQVGIRKLQQHASAVVGRVTAGEVVEITDRGRPVARLVPIGDHTLASRTSQGLVRPARRSYRDLPEPLPATEGRPPLGGLVAEARRDER